MSDESQLVANPIPSSMEFRTFGDNINSLDSTKRAKSRGIVYVAWGDSFIAEAIRSANSVKEHMDCSITLITSDPIKSTVFDSIIITPFGNTYRDKIKMVMSPYENTIFLDTDTFALGSLEPLFDLLNRFDIAYQPSAPSDHYTLEGVPMHAFEEPSAGLVVWRRNDTTSEFFELWDREYTREEQTNGIGAWDQRSMRAALWSSDVRLAPVGVDWQLISFQFGVCINRVKLVHGRGRDANRAIAICNQFVGTRLYAPGLGITRAEEVGPLDYFQLSAISLWTGLHRTARLILHYTGIWRLPVNTRPA